MREKTLEMASLLIAPFEKMIDSASFVDGFEDVPHDLTPEPIRNLVTLIKEKLSEARTGYEDAIVEVISRYLTEDDVDVILAFNKSTAGQKLLAVNVKIQADLNESTGKWRNATLEPHLEEVKRVIGATEPAEADIPAAVVEPTL